MKVAHESPNSIFSEIEKITDYTYALVHLLEENDDYRTNIFAAKSNGREIILDNSIFELGEAFDSEKYVSFIEELQPDYYIVPDSLENAMKTTLNYIEFSKQYSQLPGKKIGVIQGKTYEELCYCYQSLLAIGVDKVGISFDYSFYQQLFPNESTKLHSWMKGRQAFVYRLSQESFFNKNIPIHLLGCSLPQEFSFYKQLSFIDSLDTSNPVVHGLKGVAYTDRGLESKESQKLFTLINSEVSEEQLSMIVDNVNMFRKLLS